MTILSQIMQQSATAFAEYRKTGPAQRALFLETVAAALEARREALTTITHQETHLPLARLNGELSRTTGQLKLFANLVREGSWIMAAIDTADAQRTPPKPDTRKMSVPLGPVVVFGASNFPYAFSTAGGDTASVLAAGCTAVVRAHFAHPQTSALVFEAMQEAIRSCNLPEHTVQHVTEPGNETGKTLVMHPLTAAVAFTGSQKGGMALLGYARERPDPIPVFAEMGSVNPVLLLPGKLAEDAAALAKKMAASITLGMGQFCTNPGLMIGVAGEQLDEFQRHLAEEIGRFSPHRMLHEEITARYDESVSVITSKPEVRIVANNTAAFATITAAGFLRDVSLREEIFGPYSLLVQCRGEAEMLRVIDSLGGQLTTTLMATDEDLRQNAALIERCTRIAGRVIINEVPTGVEVCASMVHGGPFPATTDPRFTSVGASAVQRWVRPVCFQNFPGHLLPEALQNANPLGIWRTVNNEWTNR
ncbi:aldehyde dehydrogenase (NADP(+)) [Chitinophaga sp. GCM10012297]|uniref:Aldehyde dehydrogenase (NADP(+)) n=1 Tax=Chitinophaga chungangae TaxID=2821488 RepID=A0ABS3YGD7_9BACT|nr:aldehyde dehydrogenase (NADP(+)) [Chitinophaga chungangae]MBO9153752.1 aldehyde dehydrogenase (NADP(+)) [Chitinophaga chungangae]